MELRQELSPKLSLRITPQLITAQTLLHCSNLELEKAILQEMEENPALEWSEIDKELKFFTNDEPLPLPLRESEEFSPPLIQKEDGERALKNELLFQAHVHASPSLLPLIERLIEQLEPSGLLPVSLEKLSEKWQVPYPELEKALKFLQSLEPAGVGACSLQECLLLQLRQWDTEETKLLKTIFQEKWEDFLHLRVEKIAESLHLEPEKVHQLIQFVQKKLTLYPGYGILLPEHGEEPQALLPDIIIQEENGEFIAVVPETRLKSLRISPLYHQLSQKIKENPEAFSEEEKRHVYHYLERTKNFLRALESRREMLLNIAQVLVRIEERFLRTKDKRDLPPLTQSQLAEACRVSESTISRAAAYKNIQLPWKQVVPISFFLSPNQVVKEKLLQLLMAENPKKPLPDQKIAEIFRATGLRLARRTIAKYREDLKIPPTPIRKRMGEKWKEAFRKNS